MTDETKSFEERIKLLKKLDYLDYWHMDYDYDKELNRKIFKLKFGYISKDIDFEEVFGHIFVTLADKLINTTNKEKIK